MPVAEKYASRMVDDNDASPRAETIWRAWDCADEVAATNAIALAIPSIVTAKEIGETGIDKREFEFTCVYQVKPQEDDIEWSFQVGGQSVTLTHAYDTVAYTGGGRTAPDFQGGINISPKGEVQGISIERPQFNFSATKHWDRALITPSYQLAIGSIVGCVNAGPFGPFAARTVKLNGVGGAPKAKRFSIKYDFEFSPSESGVTVRDITGISRYGWQYLDVYRMVVDESESKTVDIPHSVYVHTVYPEANFAILGLV
jgi:hypothetical protein